MYKRTGFVILFFKLTGVIKILSHMTKMMKPGLSVNQFLKKAEAVTDTLTHIFDRRKAIIRCPM